MEDGLSTTASGVSGPTTASHHDGDYSTSGAFKGTGLAGYSYGPYHNNTSRMNYLFFQHHTGQIRQLISTDGNDWVGVTNSDVIIGSNARNGTPLALGYYQDKDDITWV